MLESNYRAGPACVAAALASLVIGGTAQAGFLDPALDDLLAQSAPDDIVSALFYLENQVDTGAIVTELEAQGASRALRNRTVLDALARTAAETQGDFIAALDPLGNGNGVASYEAFWIANVIRVDATPARLTELAARPDVSIAYVNHPIELVAPVGRAQIEPDVVGFGSNPEPGVTAVRAPEVWALGYDGTGIIVANMDTGVDGNHPSLGSRWLGNDPAYANNPEWAWFDPHDGINSFPYDEGGHGTHTMGSVCGGAPGDQIGVAPGARWIAAGAIDRPGASIEDTVAYAIESFQWLANPDGNLETSGDVPHVVSNSWGVLEVHGYPACDETFWTFMDNLEAAGCVVVFSAGNEAFDGLRRPSDRATDKFRTFAVGAVDAGNPSWPIAGFSSRGPSACTPNGLDAIKPDISAPGVSVRSALPGGGYGNLSGTSMASPHINGVLALVFQANPDLTPNQAKNILYTTAVDLGDAGEDNDYGFGMVDAYEAVQSALAMLGISINFPDGRPSLVDPNGGTTFRVVASGQSATPAPGTGTLYYRTGGSGAYTALPMTEVAANNYDAVFPGVACGTTVEYYVSVQDTTGETTYSPTDAPGSVYSAGAYTGIDIAFEHDGESTAGFTVVNEAITGGAWERGVPAGNGDRGDPLVDGDGSGACWLTENAPDNTDVDGGPTRLFSSVFDATGLNAPELSYQRWMTNDDGDGDRLDVEISNNGGASWTLIESVGNTAGWNSVTVVIEDYVTPTATMQLRFSVTDNPNDSVTEAGIDGIEVRAFACDITADPCPFDVDDDGEVAFGDILVVLAAWGPCVDCPADVDDNGEVNFEDLLGVLAAWGPCPG